MGLRGNQRVRTDIGFKRLSIELKHFQEVSGVPLNRRISEITLGMLGGGTPDVEHTGSLMKTKAAEVSSLMHFAVYTLNRHAGMGQPHLVGAGTALCRLHDTMKNADDIPTRAECQRMVDLYQEHLVLCDGCGIGFAPKHHLAVHLFARVGFFGNPRSEDVV